MKSFSDTLHLHVVDLSDSGGNAIAYRLPLITTLSIGAIVVVNTFTACISLNGVDHLST